MIAKTMPAAVNTYHLLGTNLRQTSMRCLLRFSQSTQDWQIKSRLCKLARSRRGRLGQCPRKLGPKNCL